MTGFGLHVNAWSSVGRTVWEGLGVALLEKVCYGGLSLYGFKSPVFPVSSLCLVLRIKMWALGCSCCVFLVLLYLLDQKPSIFKVGHSFHSLFYQLFQFYLCVLKTLNKLISFIRRNTTLWIVKLRKVKILERFKDAMINCTTVTSSIN